MKFESKFGVGEIVSYEVYRNNGVLVGDALMEVQSVVFAIDGSVAYLCRHPETGNTQWYAENQLIGDPDFDHEAGKYPPRELTD